MSLEIKVIKKKDYVYVVELKGSLDIETSPLLKEELNEIINEKTKAVLIDMKGGTYISSSGIGVIIGVKKKLKQKKANFAMIDLQPQIEKVFDAMKILPIVDIFDNMPEADQYIDQIIKEEIEKQTK